MKEDMFMKGAIGSFAKDMKKLINNKEMSDIKFIIGPNKKAFYAHRCILSTRCEVFRSMFVDQKNSQKENYDVPLVLSDMTPEVFAALLEYIYTNCVTLSKRIAIEVLACAVEYGLEELRKLCQDYLVETLDKGNACEVMQAAVTYGQPDLRSKTLAFISEQGAAVVKSKAFAEMSDEAVAATMASDNLQMDELDIIASLRDWANVNSVVLGRPVNQVAQKIVGHIRLPLLSPEELSDVEKENERDHLLPTELISYAWKMHALKKGDKNNPLCCLRRGTIVRDCHQILFS